MGTIVLTDFEYSKRYENKTEVHRTQKRQSFLDTQLNSHSIHWTLQGLILQKFRSLITKHDNTLSETLMSVLLYVQT
jgi:hypothetical protein